MKLSCLLFICVFAFEAFSANLKRFSPSYLYKKNHIDRMLKADGSLQRKDSIAFSLCHLSLMNHRMNAPEDFKRCHQQGGQFSSASDGQHHINMGIVTN